MDINQLSRPLVYQVPEMENTTRHHDTANARNYNNYH